MISDWLSVSALLLELAWSEELQVVLPHIPKTWVGRKNTTMGKLYFVCQVLHLLIGQLYIYVHVCICNENAEEKSSFLEM